MKRKKHLFAGLAILVLACLLTGCSAAVGGHAMGILYTDIAGPLEAGAQNVQDMKQGKATCTSYLGMVAMGDCSIEAAMENGGITRVHHIDYTNYSILGIIAEFTTVVYGE